LPDSIVRDVGQPFDTETLVGLPEQVRAVPQVLHLADLVAEFLTRERVGVLNELLEVGGRYQGVSIDKLESLIAALELKVPQLAEALSLSLLNETAFSTILSRAYAQLCDAADCEFGELLQQAQTLGVEIGQFAESQHGGRDDASSGTAMTLRIASGPALLGHVEAAVKSCRQARHAVSLALLELDHSENVVQRAMDRLQAMMQAIVDQDGRVMQVADDRFAVVFEGCDRQPAIESTRQLVRSVRQWGATQVTTDGHALSLSAGVATLAMPPRNFPCRELIDAAERCLHGAQRSGGDSVKSIDIY
jgi:GGDEF domain-containing protein/DNA-binding Xre family transcriptional regulator